MNEEEIVIPRAPLSFNDYLIILLVLGCVGFLGVVIYLMVA
jgi:hypothetical protein